MKIIATIELSLEDRHEIDEDELRTQLGYRAMDAVLDTVDELTEVNALVSHLTILGGV